MELWISWLIGGAILLTIVILSFRPIAVPTEKAEAPSTKKPHAKSSNPLGVPLEFANNDAFFKYQCDYGDTKVRSEHAICAQVLRAEYDFDGRYSYEFDAQPGRWFLTVLVASPKGGFLRNTMTPGPGDPFQEGDIVAWLPLRHDEIEGWNGVIIAKLAPRMDETGFKVLSYY